MAVAFTPLYKLTPAENLGNGWYYLSVMGAASGDGSGSHVLSTLDLQPYVKSTDHVWLETVSHSNTDAATNIFMVHSAPDYWSALNGNTGYYVKLFVGAGAGNATDGFSGNNIQTQQKPFYLGRVVAPVAYIEVYYVTNTNAKSYEFYLRFIVRKPT